VKTWGKCIIASEGMDAPALGPLDMLEILDITAKGGNLISTHGDHALTNVSQACQTKATTA